MALTKGGVDEGRANARLGVALARSGDLPNAQATLAQVSGPWSAIAGFWTAWTQHQDRKAG